MYREVSYFRHIIWNLLDVVMRIIEKGYTFGKVGYEQSYLGFVGFVIV